MEGKLVDLCDYLFMCFYFFAGVDGHGDLGEEEGIRRGWQDHQQIFLGKLP